MLKPWLTKGIMTSFNKKNILYRKFIRARLDEEKTTLYNQSKTYRNTINKLIKISIIIIRNIFMNTKRIYLNLGRNLVHYKHKQKRKKRHKLS